MSKTRDIPRDKVERVRDELVTMRVVLDQFIKHHPRDQFYDGRVQSTQDAISNLDALLAEHALNWSRPTSTTADMGKSANSIGCSDGGCLFRHNTGQVTNGGCNCVRGQATHTGDGWTIPVQRVQLMIASAVRVAREAQEGTS